MGHTSLDALHLIVPLSEGHFCPSRCDIATESIYSWDTHPQPSSWGTDETSNILPCLRGASGLQALPARFPSPPLLKGHFPTYAARIGSHARSLSQTHRQPYWGCHNLPSSCLQVDLRQHHFRAGHHPGPKGLNGIGVGSPITGWGWWKQTPHGVGAGHQRDSCPSQQCNLKSVQQ